MAVLKLPVATSTWNNYLGSRSTKSSKLNNVIRHCGLSSDDQSVDYNLDSSNLEEKFGSTRDRLSNEGAM
ncbi:hypothetical protein H5410_006086 [Solanum commersonii]|uniref:Uncharacterized protein n=1 Tax=Solanum commersonii TaxID=4109 RepID=A0A9J6A977_SOLCO|nr:hypothetical protein H5410_006086 [Solanum commersonii]